MKTPIRITHRFGQVSSVLLAALLMVAATGCAKRAVKSALPLDTAWEKASRLFQRERYFQAQEVLRDITLNYSGSAIIDSAQFLLARATFELEDYLTAADEFKKVQDQYPFSKLSGDAAYWTAMSYYRASPPYPLDQKFTHQAFDGFQQFVEEYTTHTLADSALKYLALCREKLARKEYAAAKLYLDLQEYASAILYADVVLANYYDTSLADPALFVKARSYFALKDWSRAAQEFRNYLERYPRGKHVGRAKLMLAFANAKASIGGATGTTP